MSLKVAFFKCTFGNKLYYDPKYKKVNTMQNVGAWRRKSDCRHSEKKLACWIFTLWTTEQAYLNLFSFMNYTWLSSLRYTPRVENILNDNLLISCQIGKIHSFLQICSWFFINILNDFPAMHLGYLWLFGEEIQKSARSHFPLSIYNKPAYEDAETKRKNLFGVFLAECMLASLRSPAWASR